MANWRRAGGMSASIEGVVIRSPTISLHPSSSTACTTVRTREPVEPGLDVGQVPIPARGLAERVGCLLQLRHIEARARRRGRAACQRHWFPAVLVQPVVNRFRSGPSRSVDDLTAQSFHRHQHRAIVGHDVHVAGHAPRVPRGHPRVAPGFTGGALTVADFFNANRKEQARIAFEIKRRRRQSEPAGRRRRALGAPVRSAGRQRLCERDSSERLVPGREHRLDAAECRTVVQPPGGKPRVAGRVRDRRTAAFANGVKIDRRGGGLRSRRGSACTRGASTPPPATSSGPRRVHGDRP